MASLNENDFNDLLKTLPAYEIYKKFDDANDILEYNDKCNDLGTNDENFKGLCKKFLSAIKKLSENNDTIEKNKEHNSLGYWIIEELWKYYRNNNKNIHRGIIDNLIIKLNQHCLDLNLNRLFYNSDFDINLSKEEKYLLDYFKNYEKIISCSRQDCEKYLKYITYIEKIYFNHREDCLGNVCYYFNYNKKYNPSDLLHILKDKIQGSYEARKNFGMSLSLKKQADTDNSEENVKMVIKYILCTKTDDVNKKFLGYKCEDPSYRQNSEKSMFFKTLDKKKEISHTDIKDALGLINDRRCEKKIDETTGKVIELYCMNEEFTDILKKLNSNKDVRKPIITNTVGEGSAVSSKKNTELANRTVGAHENNYSEGFLSGIELLSVNREVPPTELDTKNFKDQRKLNFPISRDVTLFPEYSDQYRVEYIDKDIPDCKIYTRIHGKLACKHKIDTNDFIEKINKSISVISDMENEIKNMGKYETVIIPDGDSSIMGSSMFRIATITLLIFGVLFVFFIYFKFTPFGTWLRKNVLNRKRIRNNDYAEHMQNRRVRVPGPNNTNHKKKKAKIAYHSK
ncbi:variable surface protein [Plasmodium gonderi]|uniref:Variable surface protein n=1 Tax=Plasmodium gonderi TaxID=77519 RepID=A0A1Y1JNU5_PLAGO|nr:variable surface protein [Plasmodium gonderi]GAW83198.1 variable surface protein [Plasmodium gonderi]